MEFLRQVLHHGPAPFGGGTVDPVPYLRLTCPPPQPARRHEIAVVLTDALVALFTPSRGPAPEQIRARTTVHLTPFAANELFIGGRPVHPGRPDVTAEISDWSMSVRQQRRVAARLTPLLADLFDAELDAVNFRFHSYPPTDFAVGGRCSAPACPASPAWRSASRADSGRPKAAFAPLNLAKAAFARRGRRVRRSSRPCSVRRRPCAAGTPAAPAAPTAAGPAAAGPRSATR